MQRLRSMALELMRISQMADYAQKSVDEGGAAFQLGIVDGMG